MSGQPAEHIGMTSLREILIHWFIPPVLREDRESLRQALRAMLFGLAMLVWVPVYMVVYWLLWLASRS